MLMAWTMSEAYAVTPALANPGCNAAGEVNLPSTLNSHPNMRWNASGPPYSPASSATVAPQHAFGCRFKFCWAARSLQSLQNKKNFTSTEMSSRDSRMVSNSPCTRLQSGH